MHPAIEKELGGLREKEQYIIGLEQAAVDAEAAMVLKGPYAKEPSHPEKDYVAIGCQTGTLQGVLLMLHIDSFRQVVPVLRELRGRGYKPAGKPADFFAVHRRTYDYGDIKISVFLPWSDDSTVCRRIKVGTREEAVYEWQCDDGSTEVNGEKAEQAVAEPVTETV